MRARDGRASVVQMSFVAHAIQNDSDSFFCSMSIAHTILVVVYRMCCPQSASHLNKKTKTDTYAHSLRSLRFSEHEDEPIYIMGTQHEGIQDDDDTNNNRGKK